jgi:sulfide:quinone oxidoreductase
MHPRPLSPDVSVTGQIKPTDVAAIAKLGFKSIICNRPDNEGFFQPSFADVAAAAKAAGLEARHIPVGGFSMGNPVADFANALKTMPKPILAYCASGARSASVYAAAARAA